MKAMTVSAPAKVNLSLKVVRRREDGFHEIETRMAPLSLSDTLEFEAQSSGGLHFTCSDSTLPRDESNLVVRAVRELEQASGRSFHLSIHLEKRIPHGAGLAGGSSDAAATLRSVNELFLLGLSHERLCEMAATLGSDIPFFLFESVCDCRGRGEDVKPIAFDPILNLLLIKPRFGIPTPWAYQQWKDSRELPGAAYAPQAQSWGTLENSLERPVFEKYLFLADLKSWLLARTEVEAALMSGSGSTTFAILKPERDSTDLEAALRAEFGHETWTQVCETRSS